MSEIRGLKVKKIAKAAERREQARTMAHTDLTSDFRPLTSPVTI